jgi:hypothetical protein
VRREKTPLRKKGRPGSWKKKDIGERRDER